MTGSEWLTMVSALLGVGAVAGVQAGLLGVGGGLIIVPSLLVLLPRLAPGVLEPMQVAVGTSLGTIVLTSSSSVWAHHQRGAVRWHLVLAMAPGLVVGAWLGARAAVAADGRLLQMLFGGFCWLAAAKMALTHSPRRDASAQRAVELRPWLGSLAGAGIGGISALVGIGGGTLTVPFLSARRLPFHQAVGTSSACGVPLAASGALSFASAGAELSATYSIGYIHLPSLFGIATASVLAARLGARWAHRIPRQTLRRLFAAGLIAVGSKLLWASLH